MITTDTTNRLGTTVAKDLPTVMQGQVAIADEASYEAARQIFNGAVDRRPKLSVFCESARDFDLSKLERMMSGAGKVAALGR